MMNEQCLNVKRDGDFSYPIWFRKDFSFLGEALFREGLGARHVCIVSDTNVAPLYLEEAAACFREAGCSVFTYVFPAGEENKNLSTVQALYTCLIEHGLDRKGLLAALGGGVCGDMTGFAAATYLRGIDFIQIPTTLLAQVDSSVGGKTGVDFDSYKNMVGAFHQPRLVYMNMQTLSTLDSEQFACGMGEVIKTGLICDPELISTLESSLDAIRERDSEKLAGVIRRCCEIKAGIVERDPREKGERALLNLGHTIGHAIEKMKDFSLLHGQCVAAGLVAAGSISVERGLLSGQELERIRSLCLNYDLPVCVQGLDPVEVLAATRKDKKMENGKIRFILPEGIGHSMIESDLTDVELLKGIQAVCL